jgi:hypothetical protein
VQGSAQLKEEIEKVRPTSCVCSAKASWKVAELQYGKLPQLERN